jgi:enoyl-CoA hydratase
LKRERVGLVKLNRPKMLNALDSTLMNELMEALATLDADPAIGCMVVTDDATGWRISKKCKASQCTRSPDHLAFDRIRHIKAGDCRCLDGAGGGMTGDVLRHDRASGGRFGQPEINLGVIPGGGGTQRLAKAVGKALAMEMVLNNRNLTAEEALRFGLVNRVVPVERYLEEALVLAEEVAARAPLAVRLAKEAVNHSFESFLAEGLADERRAFYFAFLPRSEGCMQAFSKSESLNGKVNRE